jgi:hypothetical protein
MTRCECGITAYLLNYSTQVINYVKMKSYGMTRCECGITAYLLNYSTQVINYLRITFGGVSYKNIVVSNRKKQSNDIPVVLVLCFVCSLFIQASW